MLRVSSETANSYIRISEVVYNTLKNNSDYQKLRNTTEPLSTDYNYWFQKALNTNISEQLLISTINETYNNAATSAFKVDLTQNYSDYIAQSFYIDETNYPNGIFLHSIDVYFSSKDDLTPITLDVRPTVNGYPSSDKILKYSSVTITPNDVNIPEGNNLIPTPFVFSVPVYIQPGLYAFTLKTNSDKYNIFVSEKGKASLIDNKIVINPYIGSFFQSQQGNTWTAEQTKDLCFRVRRCIFETGSRTYTFYTGNDPYTFDGLIFRPTITDFGDVTDLSYSLTTSDIDIGDGNAESYTQAIEPNKEIYFSSVRALDTPQTVGANVDITLFSSSNHVSPLFDLNKSDIVLINNIILPYSANVAASELTPSSGLAVAKYVSKVVYLKQGFESNGLTVYVDVQRQPGTDIEVYCKIQNTYDFTSTIDEKNWIKLPYVTNSNRDKVITTNENEYTEETYQNLELSYTANTGSEDVVYTDFDKFMIKVVFYSEDTIKVPKIKNLRAISTL